MGHVVNNKRNTAVTVEKVRVEGLSYINAGERISRGKVSTYCRGKWRRGFIVGYFDTRAVGDPGSCLVSTRRIFRIGSVYALRTTLLSISACICLVFSQIKLNLEAIFHHVLRLCRAMQSLGRMLLVCSCRGFVGTTAAMLDSCNVRRTVWAPCLFGAEPFPFR